MCKKLFLVKLEFFFFLKHTSKDAQMAEIF